MVAGVVHDAVFVARGLAPVGARSGPKIAFALFLRLLRPSTDRPTGASPLATESAGEQPDSGCR
ncbi:hypothetical protein C1Y08_11375 [Pseudomonas sp. FW306-02-F02-AA]|nr:hypothetical protein C1Y06_17270 [Pseudomonas sp. FW306-02-H06C]PMZ15899.1 hypothetical protein C1Y08_11375 [Pseudomonas sp. FW306-02-F02-AA]PMZ28385.1 hypothetical protein C1Y05_08235 [Pseudomonas sp. FW306-02-F04-BA]PMZ34538.1 hypothetical protein C1X99_11140 [Pseudomonas sp. FW306-02-H06B]PMZ42684.1 hypothetical protein C1Y00_01860 [Pseudomonas sp. FW306-2-11AB]PMZ52626.1 hypothetical protein C1Y04_13360 [Pseudomonas sp. FW306-2-11AC]PMZ58752.1 hypothetical protein C1X96_13600 [Pseudomo